MVNALVPLEIVPDAATAPTVKEYVPVFIALDVIAPVVRELVPLDIVPVEVREVQDKLPVVNELVPLEISPVDVTLPQATELVPQDIVPLISSELK